MRFVSLAFTALSVLLCVTSLALWVIRGNIQLNARYNLGDPQVKVRALSFQFSSTGSTLSCWVGIQCFEPAYINALTAQAKRDMQYNYAPGVQFNYLSPRESLFLSPSPEGFRARYYLWSAGAGHRSDRAMIGVPHWCVALLTSVAPVVTTIRTFRRKRAAHDGCCRQCGYDLRATPTKCPECGSIPLSQPSLTTDFDAIPK